MRPMRRKDRQVTDPGIIEDILSRCTVCRLGLRDGDQVYIVPLNFGWEAEDGRYTFYFHGAAEGRKLDLLRANGRAGFELDTGYRLHPADRACGWSTAFQSIIGEGPVSFVEDPAEKRRALGRILVHNTGREDWEFPDAMLNATCVYRLTAEELSCKEHE